MLQSNNSVSGCVCVCVCGGGGCGLLPQHILTFQIKSNYFVNMPLLFSVCHQGKQIMWD